jgi:SEC-C motif-containing protein
MTQKVGRNDPCPCGSGRKFKKCCLAREAVVGFTHEDRHRAIDRLVDFALRPELDDEHLSATEAFWADWVERHGEEDGRHAMELEESAHAFTLWFAVDVRLARGVTPLELMLRREMAELTPGERDYLERMRETHLRPYEIVEASAEGLRLLDLWTGEPVVLHGREGTKKLVRWDVLALRLVRHANGDLESDGLPYVYPVQEKRALLRMLRRAHRDFKATNPSGTDVEFFKRAGMRFHHFWLETAAFQPPASLVTTPEGTSLGRASAIFHVDDRDALVGALDDCRELERDEGGGWVWLGDEAETPPVLGWLTLEDDEADEDLVFEIESPDLVLRARAFLESVAGDAVHFHGVDHEDPESALARTIASAETGAAVDDVALDVQDRLVSKYCEEHYRDWPDRPSPELGNRTPRQTAALARRRFRVVELLQAFENTSDRRRLEGRPTYDFGWMWAELGLERPGIAVE